MLFVRVMQHYFDYEDIMYLQYLPIKRVNFHKTLWGVTVTVNAEWTDAEFVIVLCFVVRYFMSFLVL